MNAEDNMNVLLEGVTVTGKDGKAMNLEQVRKRVMGAEPAFAKMLSV